MPRWLRRLVRVVLSRPPGRLRELIIQAVSPLAGNPELRRRILEIRLSHDIVVDETTSDVLLEAYASTGYGPILALSELESDMRDVRTKRTKTVCTYCGVGCSFDVWTRDRHILDQAGTGAGERRSRRA